MTRDEHDPGLLWVPRAAQRRVRWKNGAGWTTELAVRPEGGGEFDWRVSIAEVDADCEFSLFPGVDRSILVLQGAGFDLHVDGEPPAHLRPGGPAHAFPGDRPARCTIVGGPSRDFNVMTRRERVRHALSSHGPGASRMLERGPGVGWVVHVSGGEVDVGGLRAADGDCVIAEPDPKGSSPISVRGAVVLVRLQML